MSRLRLAIIGFGKIAQDQHAPALLASGDFEWVAAVDPSDAIQAPVPIFRSLEALLDSDVGVDAVAICTPPQIRHPVAVEAIEQGWHVFLEKPPAATLAEVEALRAAASKAGVTLFASWHSRFAASVTPARDWLAQRRIKQASIIWHEDAHIWHPGQTWLWSAGGFGVFDPGINALSILTAILPDPVFVTQSDLDFPSNLMAPIAARMTMTTSRRAEIMIDFNFRHRGRQQWDIQVETDGGTLLLTDGGDNIQLSDATPPSQSDSWVGEYPKMYHYFAELVRAGQSDVDVTPLRLVADAFLRATFHQVDPFDP